MRDRFIHYVNEHELFTRNNKILLGVSGGVDSVVMMDLFVKSGFEIGAAHCNFCLRGEEADIDESFVKLLVEKHKISFYSKKFNTREYASENKISIQMAARELRYEWFDYIIAGHNYDYVAIAHNMNDVVETFLLNISRGTGIKGITGIKPKNNHIIRPLLFASRDEILAYSRENNIPFREDSSNASVKYARNKIRHNIIPEFEYINPKFLHTIIENIEHFHEIEHIYHHAVDVAKKAVINRDGDKILFNIERLKELSPIKTYLFEFLKPYNFSNQQTEDIISSLNNSPGKQFYSYTHRLIKDRDHLIVSTLNKQDDKPYYIEKNTLSIHSPIFLEFQLVDNTPGFSISPDPIFAYIDYDLLEFPLLLRKWKSGDYFRPFGMKYMKKLSNFFIDNKFSIPEKENTWILTSGDKIVWVVGSRVDDRFRITENTKQILVIKKGA